MRKHLIITLVFLGLALPLGQARADDYSEGLYAYVEGDYSTALRIWSVLAEQGNAYAQNNLGTMYDNGEGVPENDVEAVKWYRLAAEQGNADAQSNLGFMYANGEGVPENDTEAVKWYRLAAEQGNATAQYNLGVRYANGEGVIQSNVIAHMLANLAGAQGNKNAPELRDAISEIMTPNDISRAQEMARVCLERNYKGCGF